MLIGLGVSGFTSFAYEVYWTRSLVFVLGNSTYALTTMLSAFLTGIALGSYLVRYPLRRFRDGAVLFALTEILIGLSAASALPLMFSVADPLKMSGFVLSTSERVFPLIFTGFGVAFLVMFIPALLIGATFPLAGQVWVRDPRRTGASVGLVYAVNTMGNVLGALAPGVILLALLGIQKGILLMAVLNVSLGLVIVSLRWMPSPPRPALRLVQLVLVGACGPYAKPGPAAFPVPVGGRKPPDSNPVLPRRPDRHDQGFQ